MSFNGYTDDGLGKFMLNMKKKLGEEVYQAKKQNLENMYTALQAYINSFSWEKYEFIEEDRDSYLKFFIDSLIDSK